MESRAVEFRAEAFNLPNTVIFVNRVPTYITQTNFGVITSTQNSARILQLALKVVF